MLKPRIIPVLLKNNDGLVKTVNFKSPKYVGDPINAVRIFNEKEVDELIILDISATTRNNEIDFKSIKMWADECRMPLCYGGGIKNIEQAEKIFSLGVEKIAISSAAIKDTSLIKDLGNRVGTQSVVIVLDIKKNFFGKYELVTHNATKKTNIDFLNFIKKIEKIGIGELVINSVDRDGTFKGYDIKLAEKIREVSNVPITLIGGASNINDIKKLVDKFKIIGAAAGSLFVFKGKYRAVLINYLSKMDRDKIYYNL